MASVTEADLVEALREALELHPGPEDARTTNEWADAMRCHQATAVLRIKRLLKAGRVQRVMVRREDMRGVTQTVAAYRLVA